MWSFHAHLTEVTVTTEADFMGVVSMRVAAVAGMVGDVIMAVIPDTTTEDMHHEEPSSEPF